MVIFPTRKSIEFIKRFVCVWGGVWGCECACFFFFFFIPNVISAVFIIIIIIFIIIIICLILILILKDFISKFGMLKHGPRTTTFLNNDLFK